jgi:hypothetical protein
VRASTICGGLHIDTGRQQGFLRCFQAARK